jgi:hypothetical protein
MATMAAFGQKLFVHNGSQALKIVVGRMYVRLMALTVTPAMENFVDAVDQLLAENPGGLSQYAQLGNTETLIDQRNRLDYALSGFINAMWTSDATIDVWAKNVKHWLVEEQHLSQNEAGSRIAVARELLVRDEVAGAMSTGEISHDHAKPITQTVKKFPAEHQDFVEKELVEAARHSDPSALAKACRELREGLDLDADADARRERLYGERYLKMSTTIEGMTRLDGMLDALTAAKLKEALAPLRRKRGDDDDRTQAQRDHDALGDILDLALRTGDLPDNGGTPPQIIVTMQFADLIDGLDKIHVPTQGLDGEPLPPAQIRMLACDSKIIPAVMNGASEVLDLGRSSRTWNKAQRIAGKLRDGNTCSWPGNCSIPIRYCQLHHLDFWAMLGHTNHNKSAHLCNFHHWLVHNKGWKLWRDDNGTLQCRRT